MDARGISATGLNESKPFGQVLITLGLVRFACAEKRRSNHASLKSPAQLSVFITTPAASNRRNSLRCDRLVELRVTDRRPSIPIPKATKRHGVGNQIESTLIVSVGLRNNESCRPSFANSLARSFKLRSEILNDTLRKFPSCRIVKPDVSAASMNVPS